MLSLRCLGRILIFLLWPTCAFATQTHGGPEGLYAHQVAHLFFIFSMGLLIYWLRKRHLIAQAGWRSIQYAALFFILWNVDAFIVHWLEEQLDILRITQAGPFTIRITTPNGKTWLSLLYYLGKLDHLLCVPAMVLLYTGLNRLFLASQSNPPTEETGL